MLCEIVLCATALDVREVRVLIEWQRTMSPQPFFFFCCCCGGDFSHQRAASGPVGFRRFFFSNLVSRSKEDKSSKTISFYLFLAHGINTRKGFRCVFCVRAKNFCAIRFARVFLVFSPLFYRMASLSVCFFRV